MLRFCSIHLGKLAARAWLLTLLFHFVFYSEATVAEDKTGTLQAVTEANYYNDYLTFLKGRDPLSVQNFSGPGIRRGVVELILLQQALKAGGLQDEITFIFSPNYLRMIHLVQSGEYVMSGNTAWQENTMTFAGRLRLSPPIIRDGEYEAGIYALATNHAALAVTNLDELKKFTIVSNRHWTIDWRTLETLGLTKLMNVSTWATMVGMMIGDRVDFVLSPFSRESDLSLTIEGYKFLPLQGLKIGLLGSRHFIVSSNHPDSDRVTRALSLGLNILRSEKRITRAFTEAGFLNAKVEGWSKLN